MRRFYLALYMALLVCVPGTVRAHRLEPAGSSLGRIRREFTRVRFQLRSLAYTSETVGRTLNTPKDQVDRYRSSGAIKAFSRYLETQHLLMRGLNWEDDIHWSATYLRPGQMEVLWVKQRQAITSQKDARPDKNMKLASTFNDFFVECTGWWPPDESSIVVAEWPSRPLQSVIATLDRSDLTCSEQPATIDGCPCVVVSKSDGSDSLWFDISHGFALIKRVMFLPDEKAFAYYRNSSFKEVLPDVWLPLQLSRTIHRGTSGEDIPSDDLLIYARATQYIKSIHVNDSEETQFAPQYLPGTIVTNVDTKQSYPVSGGLDLLDESISTGTKLIRLKAPDSWEAANLRSLIVKYGLPIMLALALVSAIWFLLKTVRMSSMPVCDRGNL